MIQPNFSFRQVGSRFAGWIVAGCIVSGAALAAPANPPAQTKAAVPAINEGTGDVYLSAGLGLPIYDGNLGWGVQLGGLTRATADQPLYVGADIGLNFWSFSSPSGGPSSSATSVQLLPTAIYRFEWAGMPSVHPFLGLSVGPNIYKAKGTDSRVLFQALVRPGVYTDISKTVALMIEPKFGILRSDFIFLPTVSAVISL